eukprot:CAMPEP_0113470720 /NCGR_PEP_ID=MMETSP0014_2-20120614/16595_1 /TAXON_ID=2857 /ORGANISM="Nitzschia sp." /LENGTH=474 /DNA_ID=CAMNT_0000363307 /DNA_START=72 /DNA_END=1496 /DNA_ORIENTATION=+ /assembly_acc=CAM_ASM_000159
MVRRVSTLPATSTTAVVMAVVAAAASVVAVADAQSTCPDGYVFIDGSQYSGCYLTQAFLNNPTEWDPSKWEISACPDGGSMVGTFDEIKDIFETGDSASVNSLNDCLYDTYVGSPQCLYGTGAESTNRYYAAYDIDPQIGYIYWVEASTLGFLNGGNDGVSTIFTPNPPAAYDQDLCFQVCKLPPGDDGGGDDGNPSASAGASGDPHIYTWSGQSYDYMGECDLLLTKSETFGSRLVAGGVGLEVQIRTKIRSVWSFIDAAAIKIGHDVLEVHSDGRYYINGRSDIDLVSTGGVALSTNDYLVTWSSKYLEYGIGHKATQYRISLGGDTTVDVNVFKGLIDIKFSNPSFEDFHGSRGLMGTFEGGMLVGRDGMTEFVRGVNTDKYGQEWQVCNDMQEPSLFKDVGDGPQYPTFCKMPEKTGNDLNERRLNADTELLDAAKKACSRHASTSPRYDACLYDVLATGDIDIAILSSL